MWKLDAARLSAPHFNAAAAKSGFLPVRLHAGARRPQASALRCGGVGDERLNDDINLHGELLSAIAQVLHGDSLAWIQGGRVDFETVVEEARLREPVNDFIVAVPRPMQEKHVASNFHGTNRSVEPLAL